MAWVLDIFDGGHELIWSTQPDCGPVPARLAHTGQLFRARVACAECMAVFRVVVTAEHGFLELDEVVSRPYDPSFARPGVVSIETLREQIRAKHLDQLTVVEINVDDPEGRALVASAFSKIRIEIRYPPDRTLEEAIREAWKCADICANE